MSKIERPPEKRAKSKSICEVVAKGNPDASGNDVQLVPSRLTAADLDYVDTITCGNFTEVIRTRRKGRDEIIVAKAFDPHVWRAEYLYTAEMRFLKAVQGRWVVSFLGYIEDLEENFILMEYLSGGDLLQLMREFSLEESQVRIYAAEMFLAVDFIHSKGFMHRNIMPSNFALASTGHLKLIDFGLSYEFNPRAESDYSKLKLVTSPVLAPSMDTPTVSASAVHSTREPGHLDPIPRAVEGNTSYCAPEVLSLVFPRSRFSRKIGYSHLCDFWSMGVAIYNMLYRHLPFEADQSGCVMDKILNYKKTLIFPINQDVSYLATSLIKGLLMKERKRLGARGFSEVQKHTWFDKINWERLGEGPLSRPVSVQQVQRYYVDGAEKPRHKSFDRRASKRFSVKLPEDSDDDTTEEFLTLCDQDQVILDFDVPLCKDPSVVECTLESLKSSAGKAGPSRSHRSGSKAQDSAMKDRRSIASKSTRHKDARARETSYGQRLLAWFTGGASSRDEASDV